jgi:hypothetical protein
MKIVFLITTFLISNILYSQENREFKSWQYYLSFTGATVSNTWDLGINKYQCKDKIVIKYGADIGFHYYRYETSIDTNKRYNTMVLPYGNYFSQLTQKSIDKFIRLKPFTSVGYKIINRKKYSSNVSLNLGLGLNLWRKRVFNYYNVDSTGYINGSIIMKEGRSNEYSFLRKPDLFLGFSNEHYFQIKKIGHIFLEILIGLDFNLYKSQLLNKYDRIYLQAKIGISIS